MLEDKQIIQLYTSGRTEVADILIERYKEPLYRFCLHLTFNRHDADDLFQDTWAKAIEKIYTFDTGRPFNTWLLSIAVNTYKDGYRKAKRWMNKFRILFQSEGETDELDRIRDPGPSLEEQAEDKELKNSLLASLKNLEDTYRIPLILYYYKELSYESIAEILNIPLGTVKSRLNNGKKKLKDIMEVKGIGR